MSQNLDANQVEEEYTSVMGEELGPVFYHLWNECVWLNDKWSQYTILFGSSEDRVILLNRTAGHFFKVIQDSLWDDTLIHIARLTDPPKTGTKHNLTIQHLPDLVTGDLSERIGSTIEGVLEKSQFARDWRNRRIAHKDLGLALNTGAAPLQPASRKAVSDALGALGELLNVVDSHYGGGETVFDWPMRTDNAESLLYTIRDGLKAQEEQFERLQSGNPLPGDQGPRKPV